MIPRLSEWKWPCLAVLGLLGLASFIAFVIHPGRALERQIDWGFRLLPGAIVGEFVWDHAFKAFPRAEPIIFWTSTIGISFLWYLALSYAAIRTYRFMTRGSKP